ncbi:flavoprotein [Sphaerisporangium siamense]|uniref:flavoprotein n=1 Tax=Sphaerisporangium siamense TaxID=795645 RepID=UPI0035D58AD2
MRTEERTPDPSRRQLTSWHPQAHSQAVPTPRAAPLRRRGSLQSASQETLDAIIVAPATYNTIDEFAQGIADTYALGILSEAPPSASRPSCCPLWTRLSQAEPRSAAASTTQGRSRRTCRTPGHRRTRTAPPSHRSPASGRAVAPMQHDDRRGVADVPL